MSESSNPPTTTTPTTTTAITDNHPTMMINASSLATTSTACSALTGLNLASLQGAATDPGLLQQMLLLSQQVNKLKRSLDPTDAANSETAAADENKPGRRLSMPLKKRHKSILGSTTSHTESPTTTSTNLLGGIASGLLSLGAGTTTTTSSLLGTTTSKLGLTTATATTSLPSGVGTISPSSLASLTALLGKKLPDPGQIDMAARLEAFREARRRSNASRELLARLTQGSTATATSDVVTSPTTSPSTPTLAAALNLDTIPLSAVSRRHSLASTLTGACSRSGSLSALGRSSSIGLGGRSGSLGLGAASAMASW